MPRCVILDVMHDVCGSMWNKRSRVALIAFTCLLWLLDVAANIFPSSRPSFEPGHLRVLLDESSSIVPNISCLTASGQPVSVRVKRPPALASSHDIIAVYVPADRDPRLVLPVKWVNISQSNPDYLLTGQASVQLQLFNFRAHFKFRLIGNSTFNPVVLAEARPLHNAISAQPSQVHLALHADGRSVVVQWVSGDGRPQQLQFNKPPGARQAFVASSSSRTYTADMMCGVPATTFGFIHPGFLHTAVIPGAALGHSQVVQYKVGSLQAGWSATFNFTTLPDPAAMAAGREQFVFLVANDVGQDNLVLFNDTECPPYCPLGWAWSDYTGNSTKLVKHLLQEKDARLALIIGDLSYANGVQADWDYFGFQFEPLLTRWPLAVAPGNHEHTGSAPIGTSDSSGGECNVPYTYRYYTPAWEAAAPYAHKAAEEEDAAAASQQMPAAPISAADRSWAAWLSPAHLLHALKPRRYHQQQQQQQQQHDLLLQQQQQQQHDLRAQWLNPRKSYYSFNAANVHFLMLDSDSPSHAGSPQHDFVAADLAQVDRATHPWVVVSLHRQMVGPTINALNVQNLARLQSDYEDLFYQFGVDLVLQGHDHAYARTCPYYKGKCVVPAAAASGASSSSSKSSNGVGVVEEVKDAGAPVYVLAGHAGAGFTHDFPEQLPEWVVYGAQDQNGYLRVTVSADRLRVVSVSTDDGRTMDGVELLKTASGSSKLGPRQQ